MKNHLEAYWRRVANGTDRSLPALLLTVLLILPALLYGCILRLRALLYCFGIFSTCRLPRPVISIGNISVGGTGKTPVTAMIARILQQHGLKVAVLSRGYGGSLEGSSAIVSDGKTLLLTPEQCGDEPYLLAGTIPGLMVVLGSDRYQAGLLALERLQPDVFLLDDGFQHLRLHRDLNILLLDCQKPFGNGLTLPAGLLREPTSAAHRADLVIATRCNPAIPATTVCRSTTCRAAHRLSSFHRLDNGTPLDPAALAGKRIAACAGIADPHGFFRCLEQTGIRPVVTLPLSDHEPYHDDTLEKLRGLLHDHAIDWLITTEKDGVKLLSADTDLRSRTLTARLEIVLEDEAPLLQALDSVIQNHGKR